LTSEKNENESVEYSAATKKESQHPTEDESMPRQIRLLRVHEQETDEKAR
jgi:hypothetical protein